MSDSEWVLIEPLVTKEVLPNRAGRRREVSLREVVNTSSIQRQERQQAKEAQKQAESNVRTKRERLALRKQNSRQRAFMAFWEAMSPSEQDAFETEALEAADTMKKRLYLEASGKGGKAFEIYRQMVLKDPFARAHGILQPKDGPGE